MTTVTSGQVVTVTSGQFANGDLVEGGGTIQVLSSGTATSNTLSGTSNGSAAELEVFSGGLASGTIISSGGVEFDLGSFPFLQGISISSVVLNGGLHLFSSRGAPHPPPLFTSPPPPG